jgi:serine/threonine protein kinase
VVGQAAEQIIAGVVLSERLAVTMYGAIHRAQFGGQRNMRGLVVDPKMLAEDMFRLPLTDGRRNATALRLDHPSIVTTVAVESGGPDVVVVTRGTGRYVTVQDLIASAKAQGKQAGKLSPPVAGLIGRSVIEALAAAHRAGVIHGAVHPRSVLIDDEGAVRLGDFIVGHALTTAVAQGADSSLWRGLTGYIAPELVVGEDPTPRVDVFAVGAMLYTMLSGEVPPGSLRVTPAIERLVQRALDTDPARRYPTASDLLENLLEAMEDDRWELADRAELIREAGLSRSDSNIDEATEDLLASLGSPTGVQLQPIRPTIDLRAEAAASKKSSGGGNRLDSLLANLADDASGLTTIDPEPPRRRDPISEIIKRDSRPSARVPSLDDPDDDTPLPPPGRDSAHDLVHGDKPRANSADEAAALAAIGDLDEGAKRVNTAADAAAAAVAKLEEAARIAERVAKRADTAPRATPVIIDKIPQFDAPTPSLKSPVKRTIGVVILLGALGGGGYLAYTKYEKDEARTTEIQKDMDRRKQLVDDKQRAAEESKPDPGTLEVTSDQAGVWLRLGRTPLDTMVYLAAGQAHDLVLLHDGNDMTEAQINGESWAGAEKTLKATLVVTLKPNKSKKPADLPLQPTTPEIGTTGIKGEGPAHIDSSPSDAEVWLFLGTNHVSYTTWAGRDYELAVVRPGYKTKRVQIRADDWRDGGDPNVPIDSAKKKSSIENTVELDPDPKASKGK